VLNLKFTDGEVVQNVDWKSIPKNRVIRYMDYKVGNQTIRLMGYERYLRLKEMVVGITTSFKGMSKIILIGQNGAICDKVTIDMINKTLKKEQVPFDEIYNNQPIEDRFWRKGEISETPNIYIKTNV